ncbi:MAG TPA: hypothetical protein VE442_22665 [Jatrophihabitans sp.]|nr:hypothetical protein [Jatrophihabitans sp.]
MVLLIFRVLLGWGGGAAGGAMRAALLLTLAALLLTLWLAVPFAARRRAPEPDDQEAVS